jgi:hypothetical protein
MTPPPWTGMCQGNFAAIVKEILPINGCGAFAAATSDRDRSPKITEDSRQRPLDRLRTLGVIKFTLTRGLRRSSCPNPWTPKPKRSVSKVS